MSSTRDDATGMQTSEGRTRTARRACAQGLIALDNAFYAEHAASFSATRSTPWQGWERLAELLRERGEPWTGGTGGGFGDGSAGAVRVLDLACGNLRFERFLREAFPELTFTIHAYDSCPDLVEEGAGESHPTPEEEGMDGGGCLDVSFHELDVLDALLKRMEADSADGGTNVAAEGGKTGLATGGTTGTTVGGAPGDTAGTTDGGAHDPTVCKTTGPATCTAAGQVTGMAPGPAIGGDGNPLLDAPPCALTVCFGFMHHVPDGTLRRAVLDALVDATAPDGIVAVSFWRFMDDPRLARKARAADGAAAADPPFEGFSPAALEPGDHFLGWQDDPRPLRYCHHFDEAEIDELASSVASQARETARFSADGASGTLNRYLVLQKL